MTKKEIFETLTADQRREWQRQQRRKGKAERHMITLDSRLFVGQIDNLPACKEWREVRNLAKKPIWVTHTVTAGYVAGVEIPCGSRVLLASGLGPGVLPAYGEIVSGRNGIRIHLWPLRRDPKPEERAPIMPPVTQPAEFELPPEFRTEQFL